MGDQPGRQPIGIILSVLGVVVLDFCADASEGPIRAYLLDVADTEEQDMALNIHAASAGMVLTSEHVFLQSVGIHCGMCSRNLGCLFVLICRSRRRCGLCTRRFGLDGHLTRNSIPVSGADPVLLCCHPLLCLCDSAPPQH